MEKLIVTKNAKSANFMLNNPFLAVMVGEEKVGYFVQCTEETVNSHGSINDWDVIYYIPIQWDYQWVKKNDPFVVLYNSHTIINDAKTIFSGKRDGMIEEFLLVKKGSEICNDFLLIKDLRKEDYEKIFYALREEHYWDGKPSQMFLKEIGDFEAPYRVKYISDINQKRFALHEGQNATYSIWEEGVFKCYITLDESEHWATKYNFWEDADQKLSEKPEEAPVEEEYVESSPRRRRLRHYVKLYNSCQYMKKLKDLTPEERLSRRLKGLPEDPIDEVLEHFIGPVIGTFGVMTLLLISLITR